MTHRDAQLQLGVMLCSLIVWASGWALWWMDPGIRWLAAIFILAGHGLLFACGTKRSK